MMQQICWHGKPYYSLDAYCKNTFGEKLYKIPLSSGMTCPNRDGTLGTRGCIFCSAAGSGDFAVSDLQHAVEQGKELLKGKKTGQRFIGYFQAFTNTYAPPSYLKEVFEKVLSHPDIAGISIATRPDCLGENILNLLVNLRRQYAPKFIWIELGLQSIHETTATYIRRGYPLSVFEAAVRSLQALSLPVIVHIIFGLPGETKEQMLQTVTYLNTLPIWGVKLQLLHILSDTDLAAEYKKGFCKELSFSDYVEITISALSLLAPSIVIHRLTGDGPKNLLIAPQFSLHKRNVLNTLHKEMKQNKIWQGKCYDTRTTHTL